MPYIRNQLHSGDRDADFPGFDVIALAASAGGQCQLFEILAALPENFPAAILIVQHTLPSYPTQLPSLLNKKTHLLAAFAREGDLLAPGRIYQAPPDKHLLITGGNTLTLSDSARVCYTRPAADPLLLSLGIHCGKRAMGVILSGTGQDGAMGIRALKAMGGTTIAADPLACQHAGMPQAAIDTDCVDFVLPPRKIARALLALVMVNGAAAWFQSPALLR